MTKKVKRTKLAGFSFIEAMLSMAVLTIGIIGVIPLLTKGMTEASDSRDQEIAVLLAQEGVELVRNVRDNNWAAGKDSFLNFPAPAPPLIKDNCYIDKNYSSGENISCNSGADSKRLYIEDGFYVHDSGGDQTKFQRKLIIDVGTSDQAPVTSVVVWEDSWPTVPVSNTNCNTSVQCAYTKIVLSKWGEQ